MENKEIDPIFFIGPGKSGTTFLYNLLKDNLLFLGKKKESNYLFKKNPVRRYLKEYKSKRIIDFSNIYFWNPNLALKLFDSFPNATIIIIKRDPYSRLASHINYLYSRGEIAGDWREHLKSDKDLFLSIEFDFYADKWKKKFQKNFIELDFNKINNIDYLNKKLGKILPPLKNTSPNQYRTSPSRGNLVLRYCFKVGRVLSIFLPGRIVQLIKQKIEPSVTKSLGKAINRSVNAQDIIEFYRSNGN